MEKARSSSAVSSSSAVFGLFGDLPECIGIDHGDLGENLAVELDPRLATARDELVVRQPAARGCVDPDDPQAPHVALARLAVAVGVLERMLDLLRGAAVRRMLDPDVPLGLLQTLRRFLRAATDRFTRAISVPASCRRAAG